MKTITGCRRSISLAGAALWLIAISFVFVTWSILAIRTSIARLVLRGTFVLLGALAAIGVVVIRVTLGLPVSIAPPNPGKSTDGASVRLSLRC